MVWTTTAARVPEPPLYRERKNKDKKSVDNCSNFNQDKTSGVAMVDHPMARGDPMPCLDFCFNKLS